MFENNQRCRCQTGGFAGAHTGRVGDKAGSKSDTIRGSATESINSSIKTSNTLFSNFFLPESKPHYAPDRLVDVEHIKLEIAVDLQTKNLKGICTTDFQVIAPSISKITFDAIDLIVESVLDVTGGELRFDQSPKKLTVYLRKTLQPEEHFKILIKYHTTEPRAGLYFIEPDKDYPNRPWQLWTQGQDEDNRYWIPCHDAPNEKATSEIIVTVDERYTAISNGKLLNIHNDKDKKLKTFHWKESVPHASYLISLCIGEFAEIKDVWKNSHGIEIPVTYYTFIGRERETKLSFGKTPKMLDYFSKKIGVGYPYEKYAQVVAWDFIYGGMENISATTQCESTLHPESIELDYSSEPLVSHELAHQWFGDLLTCKEWSHAWLNEGFATYFETLWTEHEHGKDEALYELYTNENIYKEEAQSSYKRPISTNIVLNPSDLFDHHLYEKGARVLHMLRKLVGDELWWKTLQKYVSTHFARTVETVDLQRAFEETTGKALAWFFDQWVYQAGHPHIKAAYEWIDQKKLVKLCLSQIQADIGFKLPMYFKVVTSEGEYLHEIDFYEKEQTYWFACSEKPKFVSLNPENPVLVDLDFNPGRELLIAQLHHDTDVMGRVFATKVLSKDHSRESIDALGDALELEKFWGVQAEVAKALGYIGTTRAQDYLIQSFSEVSHPKARKEVMKALAYFRNERTLEIAERAIKSDPSPFVQYEAGCAIGKIRIPGIYEKLSSALGKRDSWHDYCDRGILKGLAECKDERALPILVKYTKVGMPLYLRREAIAALAHYAKTKPLLVLDQLLDLAREPSFLIRMSTIEALETLGDDSAIPVLKRITDTAVEPRTKRAALVALKTLKEGRSALDSVEKLKKDFDQLRLEYRELLNRFETLERK